MRQALGNLGTSWVNTLAADRHGNALYADMSVVPDVDAAHLWRMALPTAQQDGFWLSDRENRVALIGDGIAGAGVERAWESGTRLAQALQQAEAELALS